MAAITRRTLFAQLAAAGAAVASGPVARAADLTKVQVASALSDDIAPVLYGMASGIFSRLGLDIQIEAANSGAAAAAAVLGGSLQMAKGGTMAIVTGHVRSVPLTAIWPAAISTTAAPICGLIVSRSSGITTGKDCNGKVFTGASLQDLNQLAAMAWVDANGGDSKTMRFVETPASTDIPALEAGRIDGATVLNPILQLAMRTPSVKLLANPFDTIGKHFCSSTWFTTLDYAAKNADVVRRFVSGLQEATRYEYAHPAEMAKYLAPFLHVDEAALASFPRTTDGLSLDPSDYQPVIDIAARYGVIPKTFPASELLT
jgi:NitT/TauT family transport system substrate-binding protein